MSLICARRARVVFQGINLKRRHQDLIAKSRCGGMPSTISFTQMTQERRWNFVFAATLAVVAAAWLWLLLAYADLIFGGE